MSHWFDQLARRAAALENEPLTRRAALGGAAIALAALSPLTHAGVARAVSPACEHCATEAKAAYKDGVHEEQGTLRAFGNFAPAVLPVFFTMVAARYLTLILTFHDCPCGPEGYAPGFAPPSPPGPPAPLSCPGNTGVCPGTTACCYLGDACCFCPGTGGASGPVTCCIYPDCRCCGQ